jgi:hypothetical protein
MGRIIVNNKSSATDAEAMVMALDCVNQGRISNYGKQYCYLSKYDMNGKKYILSSALNESSDSFTVLDDNSKI